ncbi:MAG TPA: hypothetical protein VHY08_15390, partial [Bacillota bacterium]|nr:hypothetical protein [Bacillota bacterium]
MDIKPGLSIRTKGNPSLQALHSLAHPPEAKTRTLGELFTAPAIIKNEQLNQFAVKPENNMSLGSFPFWLPCWNPVRTFVKVTLSKP